MSGSFGRGLWAAVALALAAVSGAASAEEPLGIELNQLEPRGESACRLVFVVRNPDGAALDTFRADLALFDRGGVLARRISVDIGPIPADKTQVRSFELLGMTCGQIGSVLLNDVLACARGGAPRTDCLTGLRLSSRASVELVR